MNWWFKCQHKVFWGVFAAPELVAVACTLFMEAFHQEKQNQDGVCKKFERFLLCSSQWTSTQRRLRKCCWFQFIPFNFFAQQGNLVSFFIRFWWQVFGEIFVFDNIFRSCFCCIYFLNKVVKFWLPFSSHKICKKNLISHLHFFS